MFRFTIRDLLWLMVVVGMGLALIVSKQRQNAQLRELGTVRVQLESATKDLVGEKRKSRNSINALIRELEKDRGRIGIYSFHPDRQNPDEWYVKLELLDRSTP